MAHFKTRKFCALGSLVFAGVPMSSASAAEPEQLLIIKNRRFEPAELRVPAGQRVKLVVHNQDSTPEEFESHEVPLPPSPVIYAIATC